ncbi:MAG: helix-turn-helix transcriptional regulator, partial [Alphaproteobacteria bacterium]|nr:helix-turn-helix transcriptional regulator [Alphaproteobacteria bacterium]
MPGRVQDTPPNVGEFVRKLRRSRGLTLEDLAEGSGVSKSMLSQIERNKTNPTLATVWRLCECLG